MPRPVLPGLFYWRVRRAIAQQEIANLVGIDLGTVQRLESGGLADVATVRRLAEILRVDADDLLQEPPTEP